MGGGGRGRPGPGARGAGRRRRGPWGRRLWRIVALVVVALLFVVYFVGATFTLKEVSYTDDSVDLEIIEPLTPPVAQPASPPPPSVGPNGEVVRPPAWVKVPVPVFPALAMRRGVEQGVVVLRCETLATGEFGACEALSETPPGAGFAEAAIAATRQARVRPYSIDGFETDSSVTFNVRFRPPPEP